MESPAIGPGAAAVPARRPEQAGRQDMVSVRAGVVPRQALPLPDAYGEQVDFWIDDSVAPIGLIKLEAEQKQHAGFRGGFKFELVATGGGAIPQVTSRRSRSTPRCCRSRAAVDAPRARRPAAARESHPVAPASTRADPLMRRDPGRRSPSSRRGRRGGGACGPDLPERMWRSEHVRYFSREGDSRLPGDPRPAGGARAGDRRRLRHPAPIVSYYKFDGMDDFDSTPNAAAARRRARVNVDGAIARRLRSARAGSRLPGRVRRPPALLAEGAAAALSCRRIRARSDRGGTRTPRRGRRRAGTPPEAGWSATC